MLKSVSLLYTPEIRSREGEFVNEQPESETVTVKFCERTEACRPLFVVPFTVSSMPNLLRTPREVFDGEIHASITQMVWSGVPRWPVCWTDQNR
jgi:hypothetical protein